MNGLGKEELQLEIKKFSDIVQVTTNHSRQSSARNIRCDKDIDLQLPHEIEDLVTVTVLHLSF